jgi:hypothetical protein
LTISAAGAIPDPQFLPRSASGIADGVCDGSAEAGGDKFGGERGVMADKNKRWMAIFITIFVIFMGYNVGKDAALRDNRSFGPHDNSR